jgi:pimeloyl-ACP methyl ester carboxylesterase
MIPGAAVDHAIFALPTVPLNAVNYFTMCGFRVFVPVHRIGKLDGERGSWTTHDARLDIAASLEQIRLICGVQKVYIVAHCLGSVALATGLLDGTIPAEWVLGITASQVFMNPVWSIRNRFKATIPLTKIYSLFNGHWMQCGESAGGKRRCSMMDQFLRFQPEDGHERCNSAACHRVTFVFGRCWNHNNLNDLTHRHIGSLFGGVSMSLIDLVRNMGSIGSVTTPLQSHESLVTDKNMDRLANIPIFFFVGSKNAVLSPAATEKSFENLQHRLGSNAGHSSSRRPQYRRVVVDGYGHLDCWIGVNAYKDVFPLVREEIDRVIRCHS